MVKAMSKSITAWLSIGSTYTYLTALRMTDFIRQHDIQVAIRPISIRQIMKAMDNIPFPPTKKPKVDYMWRDIVRRSIIYGLPQPKVPAPYPLKEFDRANTVGIVLNSQNRYLEYLELTYRFWFLEGYEAGSEENLSRCFKSMNLDYEEITTHSDSRNVKEEYDANTLEAQNFGIFGVPSFTVCNEIFWGDDRLEDAVKFEENR